MRMNSLDSKMIIDLAGKLDWRLRFGKSYGEIKPVIKQIRTKLTRIEKLLEEESRQNKPSV